MEPMLVVLALIVLGVAVAMAIVPFVKRYQKAHHHGPPDSVNYLRRPHEG